MVAFCQLQRDSSARSMSCIISSFWRLHNKPPHPFSCCIKHRGPVTAGVAGTLRRRSA
jgi:hypothetical protein